MVVATRSTSWVVHFTPGRVYLRYRRYRTNNEDFLDVPFLPPLLAGAFAGGYKDTDGKIVFPRSMIAAMALLAIQIPEKEVS